MSAAPIQPFLTRKRTSLEPGVVSAILTPDDGDIFSKPIPAIHIASSQKRLSASWTLQDSPFLPPPRRLEHPTAAGLPVPVGRTRSTESSLSTTTKATIAEAPGTDSNFLATLARQERLVLELKEQLQKAEGDLKQLKKQWALQEVNSRRSEVRRVQQLKPLSTSVAKFKGSKDDADGSSAWMYEEMERRKALMGSTKTTQRRVFSGSRETKTLSLLVSDERGSPLLNVQTSPNVQPATSEPLTIGTVALQDPPSVTDMMALKPDLQPSVVAPTRTASQSPQRDDILVSGKQIANDIKDGFWTFFEDLRQATVGDDIGAAESKERRPSRKDIPRHTPTDGSRRESPVRGGSKNLVPPPIVGLGLDIPTKPALSVSTSKLNRPKTKRAPPSEHKPLFDDFDDSWDTWPSPPPKSSPARSNSTISVNHGRNSLTTATSSRTSTSSTADATLYTNTVDVKSRDALPWPALEKLHPGHLRRTASHLMEVWEQSLSPDRDEQEAVVQAVQIGSISRTPSPMEQQVLL